MTTRRIARMAAAILLAVSTAQAATIFVDAANCPVPGDGSIGDPYCSIQTAIDNAVNTDEVVVAPGTYFETIDFLGKAITVRSSDEPEVTIIDATDLFSSVVTCDTGEGADTVLDGFTLTDGMGTDTGDGLRRGGGMYNSSSSPTVTDCTFINNSALHGGGGMHNRQGSSPTVTNCTFSGNSAGAGGGMESVINSNPVVTDCTFSANSAISSDGGGIRTNGGSLAVSNCTFTGNTAALIGGGIFTFVTSMTVTDCTFCNNSPEHIDGQVVLSGQIHMSTFCPSLFVPAT